MGILTRFLDPQAATFGPLDDFWYKNIGAPSASGVRVTPATALTISTVYACVRIIASTLAMVPLIVYERTDENGKVRAKKHPLFPVMGRKPNRFQTSYQFRELLMVHALLRGNGYAQIVPGEQGFVDQLIPLNPDRVKPALARDGSINYIHQRLDGREEVLLQDEVFHIPNLSENGIEGLSTVQVARDSFGLTKSLENQENEFISRGQRPGGTLAMDGKLSPQAHERLRTDWRNRFTGTGGSQEIAILEEGLKWMPMGMSNEDAQFLESRLFQVEEVASWFGVPLSLLQHTERQTSWGTGITQLTHGFVTFTMQPWYTKWEGEINQDLILPSQQDDFFAEFLLEGLLRGDPLTRARFYNTMVTIGAMTRNEVRIAENFNPIPGLDEPLTPLNLQQGGESNGQSRASLVDGLVHDTAARMVRKEIGAIETAAKKHAADNEAWAKWVGEFYEGYREDLVEICKLGDSVAYSYTEEARIDLLTNGVTPEIFDQEARTEYLASLMVEQE